MTFVVLMLQGDFSISSLSQDMEWLHRLKTSSRCIIWNSCIDNELVTDNSLIKNYWLIIDQYIYYFNTICQIIPNGTLIFKYSLHSLVKHYSLIYNQQYCAMFSLEIRDINFSDIIFIKTFCYSRKYNKADSIQNELPLYDIYTRNVHI